MAVSYRDARRMHGELVMAHCIDGSSVYCIIKMPNIAA